MGFDPGDGLDLAEARLVALVYNPQLRLARLRVGLATAGAEHAGSWKDPQLSVGLLRITESVPDPWVLLPSLTFTIPLSGTPGAERDVADAQLLVERDAALEAEWSLVHRLEQAWIEWSAARLRVEETEGLVRAMDGLVRTSSQLAERGELPRTEASLFTVEQAQRLNRLQRLRGDVLEAEQRLRMLLGLAPSAPVVFVAELSPSGSRSVALDATTPGDRIEARNPGLARLRRQYDEAEASLRLEIRKQYPDLTFGPLFESEAGQSRVGFLAGIPLPLLDANRRAIAEAGAARELARAAVETEYETLVGRCAAAIARAVALGQQRTDLEQVVVPLVERQLEDAVQLLRLGEGSSLVLLESLTRAHQTKLDVIETRAAEALACAEISFLIGPEPAPPTSDDPPENP